MRKDPESEFDDVEVAEEESLFRSLMALVAGSGEEASLRFVGLLPFGEDEREDASITATSSSTIWVAGRSVSVGWM